MIKLLMVSIGLVVYSSVAYANVKILSNTELDEVALPTQQQGQLQPVLPEYDSNGQIGRVIADTNPTGVNGVQSVRVAAPVSNPVIPTLPPSVVSQLNQIFNLASQR